MRFYLDSSIWIDLYENRKGYLNEPWGDFAWKLLCLIMSEKHKLILTNLVVRELEVYYSSEELNGLFRPYENLIEKIMFSIAQRNEAQILGKSRNIPPNDALHAVIARDNRLVLVTRDNHFRKLCDISKFYKPEELI